ncbi:zeta toxin family protein [Rhizobium sp.]
MTPSELGCLILAGPNGGGKTTVYRDLLAQGFISSDMLYINTDDNLVELRREGEASELDAARLSIRQLGAAIDGRKSFAFETTLSSHHSIRTIKRARGAGYRIGLLYVILQDVALHQARIETRVQLGGHFVAGADVARRYRTSVMNLARNLELFDEGIVFDNSMRDTPRHLMRIDSGRLSRLRDFDIRSDFDNYIWNTLTQYEPPW